MGNSHPSFPARILPGRKAVTRAPDLPAQAPVAHEGGLRGHDAARARMVQRLTTQHSITHPDVLLAMAAVPRHRFVDTALVGQAYEDTSLPIGFEQTISKPQVVARMLEILLQVPHPAEARVLEIGTGCGYQAAVLRQLFRHVYSIERVGGLHTKAHTNLQNLLHEGYAMQGIHLLLGDGMHGYAKGGPYHAIIAAAGGQALPNSWLEQLAPQGRLVAPVEQPDGGQALVVVDKTKQGKVIQHRLDAVHFVPLKSGVR